MWLGVVGTLLHSSISDSLRFVCRLGQFDWLPDDCLLLILGMLDVATLCTARLINRVFCSIASEFLHSLTIHAEDLHRHPDMDLNRFENLSRVAVRDIHEADLPLLAGLAIRDVVTDMKLTLFPWWSFSRRHLTDRQSPTMPLLPNLRALDLFGCDLGYLKSLPLTLQELTCTRSWSEPDPLTRLTALTRLMIEVQDIDGNDIEPAAEELEELTALSALQHLEIWGTTSPIPCIGDLACLTHVRWSRCRPYQPLDLEVFTRLQNLVHLDINPVDLGPENIRFIGKMTSIKSLDMEYCTITGVDTSLLAPLSRLTHLVVGHLMDARLLERIKLAGLKGLTLEQHRPLGPEDLCLLQQATGLTRLRVYYEHGSDPRVGFLSVQARELRAALLSMSALQTLDLAPGPLRGGSCFQEIGRLTGLTKLKWVGGCVTRAEVAEVLRLKKLRELMLYPNQPSPDLAPALNWLLALAKLPELRRLLLATAMGLSKDDITNSIAALVNAPRHVRGWAPLYLLFAGPGMYHMCRSAHYFG
jgi:hypothetical protein